MKELFSLFMLQLYIIPTLIIFLIPALVASYKSHNSSNAILLLNILVGWTILGWILLLIWALNNKPKQKKKL